ncbi:SDR family oxidoreductase [Actinotalea sp. M2MS4P-6]|uniref:SDR family NAD(P)-dependent oxidoreductase n=1 Tax=Actinotalea sp. M2MS4P-6 TaxID=2983762 RepID=UPI0021E3EABD|nr:SDR family NAD(P)-dependent oxidoreductase [Actinotalea sp. M2MS4P-6]MCV2394257.1 SDR family oxidoreductase [Actinotalea sp. M2MS4P-6]
MAHELTAASSINDWLKHPVGGPILRAMLAADGRDESALKPVRFFSLKRVASMSGGRMTDDVIADMVARANDPTGASASSGSSAGSSAEGGPAGVQPPGQASGEVPEAEDESVPEPWVEVVVPGRFAEKTVIVTGAGSGIGRAVAARVAREGGRVVAVDISGPRLAELAAELPGVVTVVGDITKEEDVAAIVEAAGERIDGLANVAGIMDDFTPLHEVSDAVWSRVMAVNVDGMFRLSRAVLPAMLAAGRGSIVNVASEAGLRGSAAGLAYTASKHAVVGLTRSTAFMYAPSGIRVNAVAPGPVATNIQANFASELGQRRLGPAMQTLPPVAMPEQLAASITFLLSDDGTNLTGVILPSDGGWSVQ